jgi:glycosyltransferase involved in cell wall biosynthesis
MKIGINFSFARKENTGIGQYTINLVNEILNLEESQEHIFYIYAEDKESLQKIPDREGIIKRLVLTPFYKRDDLVRKTTWEKAILPRQVKKDKIETFFSPYNSASYFPLTRYIITLHDVVWKVYEKDYVNNFRKSIYTKQTFDAVKRATHLITVSEYSKKEIVKYLKIDPFFIKVIKNGVADYFKHLEDKKKLIKRLGELGVEPPYIFYIGGFEKRKNVGLLLSAFKKIVANYANILEKRKLVIAGEIWNREDPLVTNIKKTINDFNLDEKVVTLGEVSNEDKVILYNGADLLVFPSFYEGFGMPVLEAMACGCPVLASNQTAIPEVGGEAIEYFNPNREDELVQHLGKLLADSTARGELARKGMNRAREFSWRKAAEKTMDILTNLN